MILMDKEIRETIRLYDKFARQFAAFAEMALPQYELNKFISMLKGKRILDLGCGSGRDVRYFLDEKLKPAGIDASFPMLLQARERGKGGYIQMDILKLGFKGRSFDGAWAVGSI